MAVNEDHLKEQIRNYVAGREELLKNPDSLYPLGHELAGHCYAASEAFFHLTGGYDRWSPEYVEVPVPEPMGGIARFGHWYLRDNENGEVVDLTSEQFTEYEHGDVTIPYEKGTGKGFMTKEPSERAQQIIEAVGFDNDPATAMVA